MEPANSDILKKLDELQEKIEETYASAEKSRKYILWMVIATVVLTLLPLLGIFAAAPSFLDTYGSMRELGL